MNALMLIVSVLAGVVAGGAVVAILLTRVYQQRQRQLSEEIDALKQREAMTRVELQKVMMEAGRLNAQVAAFAARCEQIPGLRQTISEQEQELAASRQEVLRLKSEAVQARTRVEELASQLAERERVLEQNREEIRKLRDAVAERESRLAELQAREEEERKAAEEKLALLEEARERLGDAFRALSSETLKQSTSTLLEQARHLFQQYQEQAKGEFQHHHKAVGELMTPVRDTLQKLQQELQESEKKRHEMQGTLSQQIRGLMETQQKLQQETGNLVQALRQPQQRGRWGELQLRRVVEMAGMVQYCDFEEQVSTSREESGALRPDMIVNLPGGRKVVVDAKVSLDAYLKAVEAPPAEQEKHLKAHAEQIRQHVNRLSGKDYTKAFQDALDFVVMFIPGEPFFSEALLRDPSLIEYAAERRIVFATPTTLIALLRAIAYGWQQQNVTENARQIQKLGSELMDRMATFLGYMGELGSSIGRSVETYNKAVGSMESRLLVTVRRFPELGVKTSKPVPELSPLTSLPRQVPEIARDDSE
ncbi:MAG TPA: DNA recombination protein RmuC [Candidatus Hydrogenedentes bacterium]|nr:DNA recombination protein RmuC [Candidatus Hydrogenedentota bacterium]